MVARQIVQNQLSVRQTEERVSGLKKSVERKQPKKRPRSLFSNLEDQIRKRLETKVKIEKGRRGGKIVIQFFSDEDLDRITGLVLE